MSTIEDRVKKLIAEGLDYKPEEVTNNASITGDLGADSLNQVNLVMAAEEQFDIEIPDEDAVKIITVQDAIDYIQSASSR